MPDITTMSTLLSSVKTATEIAKLIKNSNVSLETAETKLQLAELISTLADVKIELADVQDLLRNKDQEILSLQNNLSLKENLTYDGKIYWIKDDSVPFCTVCYERDSKYHHLTYRAKSSYGPALWNCKICDTKYYK